MEPTPAPRAAVEDGRSLEFGLSAREGGGPGQGQSGSGKRRAGLGGASAGVSGASCRPGRGRGSCRNVASLRPTARRAVAGADPASWRAASFGPPATSAAAKRRGIFRRCGSARRQQQPAVSRDDHARHLGHRTRMPHLCLAHSEQRLLVAKVDFDLPAPHVMLHDALQRKIRIADDQISRLAIEQLGARARPVGQRRDHHQAQIPRCPPAGRQRSGDSVLTRKRWTLPAAQASTVSHSTSSSQRNCCGVGARSP